jgi:hypothetical protein
LPLPSVSVIATEPLPLRGLAAVMAAADCGQRGDQQGADQGVHVIRLYG